jgi:hypothetical protein
MTYLSKLYLYMTPVNFKHVQQQNNTFTCNTLKVFSTSTVLENKLEYEIRLETALENVSFFIFRLHRVYTLVLFNLSVDTDKNLTDVISIIISWA